MAAKRNTDKPSVLDAMSAVIARTLMSIAGVRVGIVTVAYPNGTADVQAVRLREAFGVPTPEPLVSKAPICWWRFGGMTMVGEVEVGDQVLVVNLQREFAAWWTTGLIGPSASERMHDPSDVVILPWIQSLLATADLHGGPPVRLPFTFRMGRVDGTAGITMWPAKLAPVPQQLTVEIEGLPIKAGSTATSFALKGTEIAAAATAVGATLAAVPIATDPATVITLANANQVAILGLISAITSNLTVKLVVE